MTDDPRPLTDRQKKILDYIQEQTRKDSRPPTVREIGAKFSIASPKGVTDHLDALESKGHLERTPGKSRGLRLVHNEAGIPIVGAVAAGTPIAAIENIEGTLDLQTMFGAQDLFAVRVKGHSMSGCGIVDGDYVVVRNRPTVENGTIAVAYIDGEATVKRFQTTATGYRLLPENQAFDPIEVDADCPGFSLAGPVVGVLRSYRVR